MLKIKDVAGHAERDDLTPTGAGRFVPKGVTIEQYAALFSRVVLSFKEVVRTNPRDPKG